MILSSITLKTNNERVWNIVGFTSDTSSKSSYPVEIDTYPSCSVNRKLQERVVEATEAILLAATLKPEGLLWVREAHYGDSEVR